MLWTVFFFEGCLWIDFFWIYWSFWRGACYVRRCFSRVGGGSCIVRFEYRLEGRGFQFIAYFGSFLSSFFVFLLRVFIVCFEVVFI